MKKIMKAYYLMFYKIYHFFNSISNDGWSEWKALLIVTVANTFIILSIDIYIKFFFKIALILELPKVVFVVLFGAFSFLHYHVFLKNSRWRKYEEEFKNYSKQKSIALGWLVFLFLLTVLGNLIFAFYQMSLIDWSKYR